MDSDASKRQNKSKIPSKDSYMNQSPNQSGKLKVACSCASCFIPQETTEIRRRSLDALPPAKRVRLDDKENVAPPNEGNVIPMRERVTWSYRPQKKCFEHGYMPEGCCVPDGKKSRCFSTDPYEMDSDDFTTETEDSEGPEEYNYSETGDDSDVSW